MDEKQGFFGLHAYFAVSLYTSCLTYLDRAFLPSVQTISKSWADNGVEGTNEEIAYYWKITQGEGKA